MAKSADAFRTISEVADWLETPAHVLRFWESKFSQLKPVKRAGGRRYYRPTDMLLLGGIKKLLHVDGMTIKGVQKMLREQGAKTVIARGKADAALSLEMTDTAAPEAETDGILPLDLPEDAPRKLADLKSRAKGTADKGPDPAKIRKSIDRLEKLLVKLEDQGD